MLDSIINEADNYDAIEAIDMAFIKAKTPKAFIGSDSVEIKYDKHFENACLLIAQKTSLDAKKMTVLQFYNALDNIKKQAEAEAKAYKSHK